MLYTSSVLTSSNLLPYMREVLGFSSYDRVKRVLGFFQSLSRWGIHVLPDVSFHKLRLLTVSVVLQAKRVRACKALNSVGEGAPYVRGIALSPPRTLVITLTAPEEVVKRVVPGDAEGAAVYIGKHVIRSKPYAPWLSFFVKGRLEDVEELITYESLASCLDRGVSLPRDWESKPKLYSLALRALDLVSTRPEITVEELAEALSRERHQRVTISKAKRVASDASRYVFGYRVSVRGSGLISKVKLAVFADGLKEAERFCRSLVRHPLTLSCVWGNSTVFLNVSLPELKAYEFERALESLVESLGGSVAEAVRYPAEPQLFAAFNVPTHEWVPGTFKPCWRTEVDPLSEVVRGLKEAGCLEV